MGERRKNRKIKKVQSETRHWKQFRKSSSRDNLIFRVASLVRYGILKQITLEYEKIWEKRVEKNQANYGELSREYFFSKSGLHGWSCIAVEMQHPFAAGGSIKVILSDHQLWQKDYSCTSQICFLFTTVEVTLLISKQRQCCTSYQQNRSGNRTGA